MKVLNIETNIDFNDIDKINDKWVQFRSGGDMVVEFDNFTIRVHIKAGFIFDYASVPSIPFFRHWRKDSELVYPSLVHDIMFIHRLPEFEKTADIMNAMMKYTNTRILKRWIVSFAVNTKIAKRLYNTTSSEAVFNKYLSFIEII